MKKILAFNDYYIPAVKCGGPVTSVTNAVNALKDEFEFYIEAANHDFGDTTPFPNIDDKWYKVGNAHVRYHRDGELDFNFRKIEEFIREVNPDIMWFSGLLVPNKIHFAIKIGEKMDIPVIISPRGEASPERMRIKGYKKYPYALLVSILGIYKKKNVYFHATSDDEIEGLKRYFHIDENKIFKVPNIGTVQHERMDIKKNPNQIRIIFISRIHEVKNLLYAIRVVNKLKCQAIFDIYGPIESEDYWKKCKEEINKSPKNVSINYQGKVNPSEVGAIYQKYDCLLFPTINENYGHVIAESLANGCRVLLSKGTTPWDDLHLKAGFVFPLNDMNLFINSLESMAIESEAEYVQAVRNVHEYYFEKTKGDNAVVEHKKMFKTVLSK